MNTFFQCEAEKWYESNVSAHSRQETLKREEFQAAQIVPMERREKTQQQDEKQHLVQTQTEGHQRLQSELDLKNEIREFMQERAEQRRLYQANKHRAELAEFWEQRAQARREYRAAKARGESDSTARLAQAVHRDGQQQMSCHASEVS